MAAALNGDAFTRYLADNPVVLADFYKDGCVACRRIAPLLVQAEAARGGQVAVARVNASGNLPLARQYDIQATPTLILFRDGQEVARHRGVLSKDDLNEFLQAAR